MNKLSPNKLRLNDFDFNLPPELIADYPLEKRSNSRLLCLNKHSAALTHRQFFNLPELLSDKDLLVFNNTRVIPARWFGIKSSGGRIEILIERILENQQALVHIKASKTLKLGGVFYLEGDVQVTVIAKVGDLFRVQFLDDRPLLELIENFGHIPLPPYMQRLDAPFDVHRYQTVYAKHKGAVAAPTAGLHFDEPLFATLKQRGIETAFITLHVGAGTFQPIRTERIEHHTMHSELIDVSATVCEQIKATRLRGGRVVAVGTTTVRALESASASGELKPCQQETQIFIYPGYTFRCVDAMITNFHLPKSSLLLLVCAFAGYETMMASYAEAIDERYRFYSYGDAMWIE